MIVMKKLTHKQHVFEHTCAGMMRMYSCMTAVSRFAKYKKRLLQPQRESLREQRVEEKAVTHLQTWDALLKDYRERRRMGVKTKKQIHFFFVIKADLKERVEVLGWWSGGRGQS